MTSPALIRSAFKDYLSGQRPSGFRISRYWFVLGPSGELLPAKAIWSLATGVRGVKFNTKDAVRGLAELGFSVVDIRHSKEKIDFEKQLASSLLSSAQARLKRLSTAPAAPKTRLVVVSQFIRNPDVIAEVLIQAKGVCQQCNQPAPFKRTKDNAPYLEVHHKKQLSEGGEDTVKNAIALCPNCHRKNHYG